VTSASDENTNPKGSFIEVLSSIKDGWLAYDEFVMHHARTSIRFGESTSKRAKDSFKLFTQNKQLKQRIRKLEKEKTQAT
jgi:hypothetical protein